MNPIPTISEAARRAFLDAYAKACQTSKPEDWHNAALLAKQWDHALDTAHPALKEGARGTERVLVALNS